MTEPKKPTSWWQTVPGVLTALAAVITAITGLVALFFQPGVLGGKTEPSRATQSTSTAGSSPASATSTKEASVRTPAQGGTKSWSDAKAIVHNRDGTTTWLRASSFSNCISVNHELSLESGQSIPFERMAKFEVLRSDEHTVPNAKATLNIELLDGSKIQGTVDAGCDLFGYNDLGRFATYYHRIQSVRFER